MRHYDEEQHAKRLILMLEEENPCGVANCPGNYYTALNTRNMHNAIYDNDICKVCRTFIGLTGNSRSCPCYQLGGFEALKRTYITLEEKGYI